MKPKSTMVANDHKKIKIDATTGNDMSRGFKNRKKEMNRQRNVGGAELHPNQDQIGGPRSKRNKQIEAWRRERREE